jgi:phosphatidylserine/phosphatidylglycerophosphate/cardiolipin synthase-like enzyme
MPDPAIEDALKATLADYRLTRSEKSALSKVLQPFASDERRLAYARNFAFQLVRDELDGTQNLELLDWLEAVVKVLQPRPPRSAQSAQSEALFSPQDGCVARIVRLFQSARQSVDVCVYTITDDRIKQGILAAHQRQVAIRIISDNEKADDLGSDIDQLQRLGVPVRVDRSEYHMHHKFAVFDQKRLLTGSYNWTRSAAEHNEENFIVTSDATLVTSFRRTFEDLWTRLQD